MINANEFIERNQTIPVVNNQRKLNSIERLAVEPQRKKRRYTKRKVDKRLTKRQFYFRHCGQCLNKFEEMTDQSSGIALKQAQKWVHFGPKLNPKWVRSFACEGKFNNIHFNIHLWTMIHYRLLFTAQLGTFCFVPYNYCFYVCIKDISCEVIKSLV